jgi:hypothetical protein
MTSSHPIDDVAGVEALATLLHETAEHHDGYEKIAAPHNWWDWYAAYMTARRSGIPPEQASDAATRYMADVKKVSVPSR